MSACYISIADALTLRAIIAIEGWLQAGVLKLCSMVDAREPNMPGVPRLEQDLQTHIASFACQGFTQTEMISLIASAHTIYSLSRWNSLHPRVWSFLYALSGMQLTEVIMLLLIKPSGLELILDGDTLKFTGEVWFWNMMEDMDHTVHLLCDNHVGGMNNVMLHATGMSSAIDRSDSAVWYMFNTTEDIQCLSLNAMAGIMSMCFAVDNKLEDQGGVGFTVQDGVVFSETLCLTSQDPTAGWLEVVVINLTNGFAIYTIGAEIDGIKIVTNDKHSMFTLHNVKWGDKPSNISRVVTALYYELYRSASTGI
ncbi:hypothetical protein B0H10DRAFT_1946274 [Mycena sp. CBHHK59/15]|nr:hypothetical protein B0H10DRAFT_1946274 [Mycena sp. CBHHK59/15]